MKENHKLTDHLCRVKYKAGFAVIDWVKETE